MPKTANVKPQTVSTSEDDFFGEQNAIKVEYFKAEKVGDRVKGVYVDKYVAPNNLKPGFNQECYILLTEDGRKVCIQGRGVPKGSTTKTQVIFGMDKIPLGAVLGFIFTEEKDVGQLQPAKIIEPRYAGERNLKVLEEYQSKFATSSETWSAEPTEATGAVTETSPALPDFGADGE